jgi:hypothetical protein
MKILILFVILTTSLLANAYECKGVDSSGNAVKIKTSMKTNSTYVNMHFNSKNYNEPVKVKSFHGSSMGHSRCPGTWGGLTFEGINAKSIFKSLSVKTHQQFYGCGFAPADSVTLSLKEEDEIIHLSCKE